MPQLRARIVSRPGFDHLDMSSNASRSFHTGTPNVPNRIGPPVDPLEVRSLHVADPDECDRVFLASANSMLADQSNATLWF